jgi:hypothetical protein
MQYGENCRIIEEVNQSGLGHQLNIVLIARIHYDGGKFSMIYIRANSMLLLRSIVLEYIHPSMYYKLGTRLKKGFVNFFYNSTGRNESS